MELIFAIFVVVLLLMIYLKLSRIEDLLMEIGKVGVRTVELLEKRPD